MHAVFALTHACNLRCTYCYAGPKTRRRMTPGVLERGLDLVFRRAGPVVKISPFGGEPLLELGLLRALVMGAKARAAAAGTRLVFGVTTNGTLFDDERLAFLAEHGFEVTVSLDGDAAAHDGGRPFASGRGSFARVVDGVTRARTALGKVRTLSVVHPGNVDRLVESLELIASLDVRTMHFVPDFGATWDAPALARLEAATNALADRLAAAYRAGEDLQVQPLHAKIASHLKGGHADSDRCDFGCEELAVAASGRLYPCERLIGDDGPENDDIVIGTVAEGVDEARVAALRAAKNAVKPDCEGCAYLSRCRWWCGCVNRSVTGRVDGVSDVLCAIEQMTLRASDRIARALYAERNPTFVRRFYLPVLGSAPVAPSGPRVRAV